MSKNDKDCAEYSMCAVLNDGNIIGLDQPEFVGDGIKTLDDAIKAARDAMEYNSKIVEVRVYCNGKCVFAYDAYGLRF